MSNRAVKVLFLIAAWYDILLGLVFCLFFKPLYGFFHAPPPNNAAYVQLPALLVLIFGVGFYYVFQDPFRNRDLIVLGILMKLAFVAVVFGHLMVDTIPVFYLPFAAIDIVFAGFFMVARAALKAGPIHGGP